ncbi:MAG: hypothetical protein QM765_33180 [Myxococcales bacterium]
MSTPCILAVGSRESWRGVPCKMDGVPGSTGPTVIDQVVRGGGVAAAAKALVGNAPLGWDCAGGSKLEELDDFLAPEPLNDKVSSETLGRHFAVYVLDPAANRLEVLMLGDRTWLEPVCFAPDGHLAAKLPAWYPQLGEQTSSRATKPEAVSKELRKFCLDHSMTWLKLEAALSEWIAVQLGDLAGVEWLYLGDGEGEHLRVLIGEVPAFVATEAWGKTFTASDGKLRRVDVDDLTLAEKSFAKHGLNPVHAQPAIELLFSLAYRHGSPDERAHSASWYGGSLKWKFHLAVGAAPNKAMGGQLTVTENDLVPSGWFPYVLAWLF